MRGGQREESEREYKTGREESSMWTARLEGRRGGKLPKGCFFLYSQCWWKDHWCKFPTRRVDRHPCQWNASPVHRHPLEEQEHQTGVTTRSDINLPSQRLHFQHLRVLQKLMHGRARERGAKGRESSLAWYHFSRLQKLWLITDQILMIIATTLGNYLPSRVDQPTCT